MRSSWNRYGSCSVSADMKGKFRCANGSVVICTVLLHIRNSELGLEVVSCWVAQ
jgi:hypothetical protein